MPQYTCPTCKTVVVMQSAVARGAVGQCTNCNGATITSKTINANYNPYVGQSFVAKKLKTGPTVHAVVQGRSPAAPVRTAWPGLNLNAKVTYVPSLQNVAWTNATDDKICLAYNCLDPNRNGKEGILIDCSAKVGKVNVLAHFTAIKVKLESPPNPTAVAEATGEAAAAFCILSQQNLSNTLTLLGFNMEWGMYIHSGGGIDQIWKRTDATTGHNEYLIVEAKGPGQSLNLNTFMPPQFFQMSTRWIMHNLETMSRNHHQIAIDIITDLKLTMGVRWAHYNGASKSYYGVKSTTGPATAELYGVVITARWQPDGMLSYSVSNFRQYTNFAF